MKTDYNPIAKMKKLIITNEVGSIHITNCTSVKDALDYIHGLENIGKIKVVSAIIWDEQTGARDQIRGGGF